MINLALARSLLRQAVETQGPDFRYYINDGRREAGCAYVPVAEMPHWSERNIPDDDPRRKTGCLIGVALDKAGVTIHRRPAHATQGIIDLVSDVGDDLMTDDAATYFAAAQYAQDRGSTWGEALDRAELTVSESVQ